MAPREQMFAASVGLLKHLFVCCEGLTPLQIHGFVNLVTELAMTRGTAYTVGLMELACCGKVQCTMPSKPAPIEPPPPPAPIPPIVGCQPGEIGLLPLEGSGSLRRLP